MASDPLPVLIHRWRDDPGATYQTWFLWEERLKNFRSIHRGLIQSTGPAGPVRNKSCPRRYDFNV